VEMGIGSVAARGLRMVGIGSGNWGCSQMVSCGIVDSHYMYRQLTLCSPVVTISTASLTFNNSTFCPHRLFMCVECITEKSAIISLYSIN
jgi:hypothetical protein